MDVIKLICTICGNSKCEKKPISFTCHKLRVRCESATLAGVYVTVLCLDKYLIYYFFGSPCLLCTLQLNCEEIVFTEF